jgi:ATP-dependent Clp protease ATP-binding subunit ClpB
VRRRLTRISFSTRWKRPSEVSRAFANLDDGRLTDGQGRVVDFRNAIIIMTSNIGSELILEAESMEAVRKEIDTLLKLHFKPEFLNRIDEIVLFERLSETMISAIADLRLEELAARLKERDISIDCFPMPRPYRLRGI